MGAGAAGAAAVKANVTAINKKVAGGSVLIYQVQT
jgi:hypothetical protein